MDALKKKARESYRSRSSTDTAPSASLAEEYAKTGSQHYRIGGSKPASPNVTRANSPGAAGAGAAPVAGTAAVQQQPGRQSRQLRSSTTHAGGAQRRVGASPIRKIHENTTPATNLISGRSNLAGTPLLRLLAENKFSDEHIWAGHPDIFPILHQFKRSFIEATHVPTQVVIHFHFPKTPLFNAMKSKAFKVNRELPISSIVALLCKKARVPKEQHRDYTLATLKSFIMNENEPLAAYGVGVLYEMWELVVVKRKDREIVERRVADAAAADDRKERRSSMQYVDGVKWEVKAQACVVSFALPPLVEFEGLQAKVLKVSTEVPVRAVIELVCQKVRLGHPERFCLVTLNNAPQPNFMLDDDCALRNYGLGARFVTWKLKLAFKELVQKNVAADRLKLHRWVQVSDCQPTTADMLGVMTDYGRRLTAETKRTQELNVELNLLEESSEVLEGKLLKVARAYTVLHKELNVQVEAVTALRSERAQQDVALEEWKTRFRMLREEADEAAAVAQTVQWEKQLEIDNIGDRLMKLEQTVESKDAALAQLTAAKEELAAQLAAESARAEALEGELTEQQTTFAAQRNTLKDALMRIKEAMNKQASEQGEMERKMALQAEKMAVKDDNVAFLKAELEKKREELETARTETLKQRNQSEMMVQAIAKERALEQQEAAAATAKLQQEVERTARRLDEARSTLESQAQSLLDAEANLVQFHSIITGQTEGSVVLGGVGDGDSVGAAPGALDSFAIETGPDEELFPAFEEIDDEDEGARAMRYLEYADNKAKFKSKYGGSVDEVQRANRSLKASNSSREIGEALKEVIKFREEKSSLNAVLEEHNARYDAMKKQLDDQLLESRAAVAALESERESAQMEITALSERTERLAAVKKSLDAELASLREEADRVAESNEIYVDSLKGQLSKKEAELQEAESNNTLLEEQVRTRTDELAELGSKHAQTTEALTSLKKQMKEKLTAVKAMLSRYEAEKTEMTLQLETTRKQLENRSAEKEKVMHDLVNHQLVAQQERATRDARIKEQEATIKAQEIEIKDLLPFRVVAPPMPATPLVKQDDMVDMGVTGAAIADGKASLRTRKRSLIGKKRQDDQGAYTIAEYLFSGLQNRFSSIRAEEAEELVEELEDGDGNEGWDEPSNDSIVL